MTPLAQIRQLYFTGQRRQAVKEARQLAANSSEVAAHHVTGWLELNIGNLSGALAAFRRASSCTPHAPDALHNDWGTAHARRGEFEDALTHFEQINERSPLFSQAQLNCGAALLKLGAPADAQHAFLRSLETSPTPEAVYGLCRALAARGQTSAMQPHVENLLKLGPSFSLLDLLLEVRWKTAIERFRVAQAFKESLPQHSGVVALWLRSGNECAAPEAREHHTKLLEKIRAMTLSPNWRKQLPLWLDQIRTCPSFERAPTDHATVGGRHSGDLFSEPTLTLETLHTALTAQLHSALNDHDLAHDTTTRPQELEIHAWAVELSEGHHQELHFHPEAWMSGCLYLAVPDRIRTGTAGGQLRFPHPTDAREEVPCAGKLLLFPSSLDHETVPQTCEGKRMSVAFDFVPPSGKSPS